MLDIKRVIASAPKKPVKRELQSLSTPWSDAAVAGHPHPHPHPQFRREAFFSLDGWWSYAMVPSDDAEHTWQTAPIPSKWDGRILVPFSPEAPLSGVNRQLNPDELLWYKRMFSCPDGLYNVAEALCATELFSDGSPTGTRCILHFEAVDYACACYCNGELVGTHIGGYLPFSFDITDALAGGENELALCVYDPSDEGVQLRGKQKLERGGIWYTAQSGIWQTVWLEVVPQSHIESLRIDTKPDDGLLTLSVTVQNSLSATGSLKPPLPQLTVKLLDDHGIICIASSDDAREVIRHSTEGTSLVNSTELNLFEQSSLLYTLTLAIANPHLWSPEDPYLYQLELVYGEDKIESYTALRTITMEEDEQGVQRLFINQEPYFLRGVLDQGYWPDGLMTAPSDDALIYDIETMKKLGFNMMRKHNKIEADRWYYHCDRLGMLVWQDMVSGGSAPKPWYTSRKPTLFRWTWGRYSDGPSHYRKLSSESSSYRTEWLETCTDAINYLGNHPSIITWVLFNEGWGQFDARDATNMVRKLDATRPIDATSGWYDQKCGDFLSVHNYFRPLEVYKDSVSPKRAFIISEFGGLTFHIPEHSSLATSYGYYLYTDIYSYRAALQKLLAQADNLEQQGLAGFVYTQLSDVEEETNGILTYDRRVNKLATLESGDLANQKKDT